MRARLCACAAALLAAACQGNAGSGGRSEVQVSNGAGGMGGPMLLDQTMRWGGTGGAGEIPVHITGASDDTTYHSTTTFGANSKVVVYPAGGGAHVEFTAQPLSAEYFHVGRVLIVTVGPEGPQREIHYFVDPIRWSAVPR
jgi:hypothetical protein